ncbi:hypothetical protein [Vibrio sonorensis]|uniref:hypothetical protein n=1 Tax=Vibrio sonorensis TaxID=1004316 RepID=UPI0008D9F41F|nr:hypothetical protein [Vibrio sonorensis]
MQSLLFCRTIGLAILIASKSAYSVSYQTPIPVSPSVQQEKAREQGERIKRLEEETTALRALEPIESLPEVTINIDEPCFQINNISFEGNDTLSMRHCCIH